MHLLGLSPLSVAQSRKPFQLDYLPLSYVVLGRRSKSSGLWVKLARSTSGCTSLMDKRVMLFLSRDKSRLLFEPLVDSSDNSLSWLYASSCSFDKPSLAGSCVLLGLTFGLGRTLRKICTTKRLMGKTMRLEMIPINTCKHKTTTEHKIQ